MDRVVYIRPAGKLGPGLGLEAGFQLAQIVQIDKRRHPGKVAACKCAPCRKLQVAGDHGQSAQSLEYRGDIHGMRFQGVKFARPIGLAPSFRLVGSQSLFPKIHLTS